MQKRDLLDEVIKDKFEGLSAIFILPKLKGFIKKIFPFYRDFLSYSEKRNKYFNPVDFGFIPTLSYHNDSIWYKNNLRIKLIYKEIDNNIYSIYSTDEYTYSSIDNRFGVCLPREISLFCGKVPNHQFATELFENLGLI